MKLGQENLISELGLTHNEQQNEFCSVYTLAEMEETISQLCPRWVLSVVVMEDFSWYVQIKTVPMII